MIGGHRTLTERLDAARLRMVTLASRSEQSGLFDATAWAAAVEQVEQVAEQVPDAEIAERLREAVGWLENGSGGPAR
jgi:hypothetical protein